MKASAKILLIGISVPVAIYLPIPLITNLLMRNALKKTYEVMTKSPFECSEGQQPVVERWGHTGWMRHCGREKHKEGLWEAWEGGYLNVKGQYIHGKKEGTWLFYDRNGSTNFVVKYTNGVKVEKTQLMK